MKPFRILLFVSALMILQYTKSSCQPTSEPERTTRTQWWREAKFGMFIHWGLYAIPAGEWKADNVSGHRYSEWIMHQLKIPVKDYELLAQQFNPLKFDATAWVKIAKSAGMKYLVITAKHHDGFSMFDSKVTNYDIVDATPFGKDPLKELAIACQKEGIKLGIYYSVDRDWHHPDAQGNYLKQSNFWDYPDENAKDFDKYLETFAIPQLTELLTNYGKIAIIWFDDIGKKTDKQNQKIIELIHNYQPECIINSRLGEWNHYYYGDYREMDDNNVSNKDVGYGWENPGTIGKSYAYNKYDTLWKSSKELIHLFVDIVSNGGNYLLNVGPTADGIIPEQAQLRLREFGKWMNVNGESIYGTKASKLLQPEWGRITAKDNKEYLHVFDLPANKEICLKEFVEKVTRVYLLADLEKNPMKFSQSYLGLTINIPEATDEYDTVVVVETTKN